MRPRARAAGKMCRVLMLMMRAKINLNIYQSLTCVIELNRIDLLLFFVCEAQVHAVVSRPGDRVGASGKRTQESKHQCKSACRDLGCM